MRLFILPVSAHCQGHLPLVSQCWPGGTTPRNPPVRSAPRCGTRRSTARTERLCFFPRAHPRPLAGRAVAAYAASFAVFPVLAVGVTWALAAGNAPAAALPRRRRAADLDPPDRSIAKFDVKPPDQHRGEQPDLSRPGGRVGRHRELAVGEAVGAGVRRQVVADDFRPAAEHRAHRRPLLPAPRVEQAADGADQRLRVFPAGASASRPGSVCPAGAHGARTRPGRVIRAGCGYAGSFGIIALAGPWLALEAGRQIAP